MGKTILAKLSGNDQMKYGWISIVSAIIAFALTQMLQYLAEFITAKAIFLGVISLVITSLCYVAVIHPHLLKSLKFRAAHERSHQNDKAQQESDAHHERNTSKHFSKELDAVLHKVLGSNSKESYDEKTAFRLARILLQEHGPRSLLRELGYKVDKVIKELEKKENEGRATTENHSKPSNGFQRIIQVAALRSESDMITVWDVFHALVSEAPHSDKKLATILRSGFTRGERATRSPEDSGRSDRTSQWHEVLGVSEQVTEPELKAAYRHLISMYHPDRVSGLGPELVALATRRAYEINQAYETAKRIRR